jgi:hypothetical protein
MRRLLAWVACGAGALLFLRRLRRPRPAAARGADPAEELRRKLDAARAVPAEPRPAPEPEAPGLDERRRGVHERGRAAIDRMRGEPPAGR